jgi:transcriptional antiterminator/mannitol/fructose-specific phosphotransferase system IIA component (Ntr-type)
VINTIIGLSSRSKRVLSVLLNETDHISTAEIATRLSLTNAQTRYCFSCIEQILLPRDINLMKKPRIGVKIDATAKQRDALWAELNTLTSHQFSLEKEERYIILALRLLINHKPIRKTNLSKKLGVSRTSFYRDLAQVKDYFKDWELTIESISKESVILSGREEKIREATIELLSSNINHDIIVEACLNPDPPSLRNPSSSHPFEAEAFQYINKLNLYRIDELINSIEDHLQVLFIDQAHVFLALSLGIALYRAKNGKYLRHTKQKNVHIENSDHYRYISNDFESMTGITLPIEENQYLLDLINQSFEIGYNQNDHLPELLIPEKDLALRIAREVAKYLHVGLLHDDEFIRCLTWELSSTHNRSYTDLFSIQDSAWTPDTPIVNFSTRLVEPILREAGYPVDQKVLEACAIHINTALNRLDRIQPRRKVWVICGAGLATAQNLISQLQLNIPQLEVLGVASVFELARNPNITAGADAIISTILFERTTHLPLIHVSPFLSKDDIFRINKSLGLSLSPAKRQDMASMQSATITEILSTDSIMVHAKAANWEEVVVKVGNLLYMSGAVWPSYTQAMIDMIKVYGPYMLVAPNSVLLHAGPDMGAKKLGMSLITLETPVNFGHEQFDPVQLGIAFSSVDHSSHIQLVEETMQLLRNDAVRKRISKATTPTRILSIIQNG